MTRGKTVSSFRAAAPGRWCTTVDSERSSNQIQEDIWTSLNSAMNIAQMVIPRRKLMQALMLPTACNILDDGTYGRTRTTFEGRTFHTSTLISKNYYDVLGLTPRASDAQVKSAYYRLSKQFHPDLNKSKDAKNKFAEISEAYETLGNRARRRIYDGAPQRSRVGLQSTSRGKRVDAEYDNLRKTSGQFKHRPSTPMTGKTANFNFDEHYKQHYGELFEQTRILRQKQRQYEYYAQRYEWDKVGFSPFWIVVPFFAACVFVGIIMYPE